MIGSAVPLFVHLFVWGLTKFKDDLMWLQHDNWSELHYSSVTQYSISYSIWPFLEGLAALFLVFFVWHAPHPTLQISPCKTGNSRKISHRELTLGSIGKKYLFRKEQQNRECRRTIFGQGFCPKKRRKVEKRKSRKDGRESRASYYDKMICNYWIR